jgi:hypothetical protein
MRCAKVDNEEERVDVARVPGSRKPKTRWAAYSASIKEIKIRTEAYSELDRR